MNIPWGFLCIVIGSILIGYAMLNILIGVGVFLVALGLTAECKK